MVPHALRHRSRRATGLHFPIVVLAALAILLWSVAGLTQGVSQAVPLPALGADLKATSVSGLSSGAFMASQFHIAHSSIVIGVGIVAGGPYGCAEAATPWFARWYGLSAVLYWATGRCMQGSRLGLGIPANGTLEAQVHALARSGRIDPLPGIARASVYVFTSTADTIVKSPVVDAAEALYASLGVPRSSFKPVRRTDALHAFVTEEKGAVCGKLDDTFITDCDYDQAGGILRHIYPDVGTRKLRPSTEHIAFRQEPFAQGSVGHSLADTGYAYVPPECRDAPGCRVHVVFHGCKQAGEGFVRDSGYAEWADGNRLIVLFPQVKASSDGLNPYGCWDWWGYTGAAYLTREGAQIAAVKRMLDGLAQPRGSN
jgi:poly(3-hydroxybutyrate) depolymerase